MHPQRNARAPRLEEFLGTRNSGRANRARLAAQPDVDVDTVLRWANGEETIPDDVIASLAEQLGVSVRYLMRWEDAPRGVIPDHWRTPIAQDAADRVARLLPGAIQSVLDLIEWRLRADADLDYESPEVFRLQRLRTVLLEFVAEPIEEVA